MSEQATDPSELEEQFRSELQTDQRTENRLMWKGLAALVITVCVALARQRRDRVPIGPA